MNDYEIIDKKTTQKLINELQFLQEEVLASVREAIVSHKEIAESHKVVATKNIENTKLIEKYASTNIAVYSEVAETLSTSLDKMSNISQLHQKDFKVATDAVKELQEKIYRLRDIYMKSIEDTVSKSFELSWEKIEKGNSDIRAKIDSEQRKIEKRILEAVDLLIFKVDRVLNRAKDSTVEINKLQENIKEFLKRVEKDNKDMLVYHNEVLQLTKEKLEEIENKNRSFFEYHEKLKKLNLFFAGGIGFFIGLSGCAFYLLLK